MTDPVFFAPSRRISVSEIAELTGAKLADAAHGDRLVSGIASATDGGEGKLVFVEGKRNAALLEKLTAAAVLCTSDFANQVPAGIAALVTAKPQRAFASGRAAHLSGLGAAAADDRRGRDFAARRHLQGREAGRRRTVEAGAVIGPGVAIGAGTVIAANAVIGPSTQIGRDCYVGPGASIQCALIGNRVFIFGGAQIGREGFGFVAGPRSAERLPQIGRVVIQDDVEIGANTTVDRGAMADTVIGEGTKIDNLVQIAHNVSIGRGCMIAGKVGLSGSRDARRRRPIGGGAGIADHMTIGSGAQLAAGRA